MRSKAIYNLHVWRDVLQEQGDKAKGSRGGITAVQQSCQSTSRGGYTQPTVRLQPVPTHEMRSLCCYLNQDIFIFLNLRIIFIMLSGSTYAHQGKIEIYLPRVWP